MLWIVVAIVCIFLFYLHNTKVYLHFNDTALNKQIISKCPTIRKRRFYFTPYLFNGILQALMASQINDSDPKVKFKRTYVDFGLDFGYFALDWGYGDSIDESEADQPCGLPVIIVLSGLTASKAEHYIAKFFGEATRNKRWRIVLINDRLYNNRTYLDPTRKALPTNGYMNYVEDFRRVFWYLTEMHPDSQFYAVGHSFGANTLTRYLGICGANGIPSRLRACVSICNPFDFQMGIRLFHRVSDYYIRFHRQKILKIKQDQFIGTQHLLNFDKIFKASTSHEFDDLFTKRIFGASTVDYHFMSVPCINLLDQINVPMLFLGAQDDPISQNSVVPYYELKQNVNFIVFMTKVGGHVSWLEQIFRPTRWYYKPVLEYLQFFTN